MSEPLSYITYQHHHPRRHSVPLMYFSPYLSLSPFLDTYPSSRRSDGCYCYCGLWSAQVRLAGSHIKVDLALWPMKRDSLVPAKNKRVLEVFVHVRCDLCAVVLFITISNICYANHDRQLNEQTLGNLTAEGARWTTSFARMPAHLNIDA